MFGHSVSISGNYAIIGAVSENENALGTDSIEQAGSAYIFERDSSGNWSQAQKIVASDRGGYDNFGFSVAISGSYAIIGAKTEDHDTNGMNTQNDAGAAYIFERDSVGNWAEVQKVVASDRASNDFFGWSVAISGNQAMIGAFNEDEDISGSNTLNSAGAVYIFDRNGSGTWSETQKLVASDRASNDNFGIAVSISGNYALIGAHKEDHDSLGNNSMNDAGAAYVFEKDGNGVWNEAQKITASDRTADDLFGYSVAISGNFAVIGAYQEDEDASGNNQFFNDGAAYFFERNTGGTWSQVQKVVASDRGSVDYFGYSVAIDGNNAVVGAWSEDQDLNGSNNLTDAGSAYLFNRDGNGAWNETQKIIASDRAQADNFSRSVAISGNYTIIGAHVEDEDSSGNNTLTSSGSAYIFQYSPLNTFVQSITNQLQVSIFPNPTSNTCSIQLEPYKENASMTIYSVLGEQIITQRLTSDNTVIDLEDYKSGIYFIRIHCGKKSITKRLIKN